MAQYGVSLIGFQKNRRLCLTKQCHWRILKPQNMLIASRRDNGSELAILIKVKARSVLDYFALPFYRVGKRYNLTFNAGSHGLFPERE
ncbi:MULTISPECIES: hypothetical protein [unclassified Pseudomonas]|uniref:hypothetical protein n=1 Tax=unclassified Pseudomonas TaxID=196821 RepID=UPI003132A0FF